MSKQKGTILVVDDSATMRNLIKSTLEPEGYAVMEAKNGVEALIKAMSGGPPDLITLDIDMPKMDGFDACRKILCEYHQKGQLRDWEKRIRVVFVTANDTVDHRRKGFEAGAADFIAKPFTREALIDVVERIIAPQGQMEGMTALVVDDSPLARNLVAEIMIREGLTVIQAENGLEALDIVKKKREDLDIIVTDLLMPEMDGIGLCGKVRRELKLDEIPIIFLTSMADQQQLLKVFHAGATDYLIKPFFKEELLARLRVHLEKSKLIRRLRHTIGDLRKAEKQRAEHEKLQGVVEMAGAVCHELNQPIQTISGFAELAIMNAGENSSFIEYVKKIKEQVDRMGVITSKLMRVTAYHTKSYVAGTRIIDIDRSSCDS